MPGHVSHSRHEYGPRACLKRAERDTYGKDEQRTALPDPQHTCCRPVTLLRLLLLLLIWLLILLLLRLLKLLLPASCSLSICWRVPRTPLLKPWLISAALLCLALVPACMQSAASQSTTRIPHRVQAASRRAQGAILGG